MSTVVTCSHYHCSNVVFFQGPGAWFDAMDVDRTGDLDLDEASRHRSVVTGGASNGGTLKNGY